MTESLISEAISTASRICGDLMADTASSCRFEKRYLDDERLKYYQLRKKRRRRTISVEEKKQLTKEIKALELKIWIWGKKKKK